MPEPEEDLLEVKARLRLAEQIHERIRREGFETSGWDPDDDETCIRATPKKPRHRYVTEPCGEKAFIGLIFRTPEHPEGVRIPLCRRCLVAELKNLMGYLD